MKIKNEYVKIKTGGKNYDFSNLILDEYLNIIASSQCSGSSQEASFFPALTKCYIRLDRKLIFDETSELDANDFTFELTGDTDIKISDTKNDRIGVNYTYDETILENYQNRQITAIGFFTEDSNNCCACLDVYNFGLKTGADIRIFRKDILQTETPVQYIEENPSKYGRIFEYPIHLSPVPVKIKGRNSLVYAYLSGASVATKNVPRFEFNLNNTNKRCENNKIIIHNDTYFLINDTLNILEPGFIQPMATARSINIFNAYKYIYLRYDVREVDYLGYVGSYYVGTPIETIGEFEYAISYERSDS